MKNCLLLLFSFCFLTSQSQNAKSPVVYKKAVSINPLALLDVDHTLMVTGEYRLKYNMALLADVGYVFFSDYLIDAKKAVGFHIKPAIRFYHGKRNKGYFQVQPFHKMVTYTLHDWIGKECVNGVPSYDELKDFQFRKNVSGLNLVAGTLLPLGRGKWLFDLYGGLGFRYKKQQVINEPNSCYNLGGTFGLNIFEEEVTSLNIPMGLRLTRVIE
jgi:hypothetical protein